VDAFARLQQLVMMVQRLGRCLKPQCDHQAKRDGAHVDKKISPAMDAVFRRMHFHAPSLFFRTG
jgi:hypothetical protein